MHKSAIFVLVLSLFGNLSCDNNSFTPASPTAPTPNPIPSPPSILPRVDAPFSWEYFQGYTAFALGNPEQTEGDVRSLIMAGMSYGWNTPRMCSETEFWDGDPFYLVKKPRDIERLKWTLDIIASIPGAQVLLIGDCTLKGPVPEGDKREWSTQVAELSSQYENIAIETHNEFDNCSGRGWGPYCPGKQDVSAHMSIYRSAGLQYVTADDRLCKDDFSNNAIGFRLANIGAYPADFHACRDYPIGSKKPWDPSIKNIRDLIKTNGQVLFSETVAWADFSGICDGLRTCDPNRIQAFIDRCAQVDEENGEMGCKFVYHSEALLGGMVPTFWPQAK